MERKRLATVVPGLALLAVMGTGGYAAAQTTDTASGTTQIVRAAEPGTRGPDDQIVSRDEPGNDSISVEETTMEDVAPSVIRRATEPGTRGPDDQIVPRDEPGNDSKPAPGPDPSAAAQ